ncbi:MAG: tripartite tricarboxylate transporter substrate binding protein [Rhodospirillales bacterium]|nr:tripartite tricarboxylate transporter substrate binding protein [Rhodospirillales bacterium]QQS14626.1 MAG: tripartite tricarboxylate transporter substrate binding protein [Rhodospirillales bacterium]
MIRQPRIPRRAVLAAAALPALAAPSIGRAQAAWKPTQSVRIVVPAAPGGGTDILARLIGAHLQQAWGVSVVIDNKSGAGGVVGTMEVLRANPDGHTILMGNIGPQSIAYSLYRNLPYKIEGLVPVSNVLATPNVLVVHPSVPATTVPEFVAWLRKQDGKVSYASSGTGQSPHLSGAWFLQLVGAKATHVPYRGAAPALADLVAGQTQYFFDNLTTAIEFVRAGKLRALGITSARRNPMVPELQPIRETMPELAPFDVSAWFGMFYAAGVPKAAVDSLNAEIKVWIEQDATKKRFEQMAGYPAWSPPAEFAAFVNAQIAQWKGVIQKEGLQLDVN